MARLRRVRYCGRERPLTLVRDISWSDARQGAGIGAPPRREQVVGAALDHLIGTWTEQEARQMAEAMRDFETPVPTRS